MFTAQLMIYDGQHITIQHTDCNESITVLQRTSAADNSNGNLKHFSLLVAACCSLWLFICTLEILLLTYIPVDEC